jgi:hypothetical protein
MLLLQVLWSAKARPRVPESPRSTLLRWLRPACCGTVGGQRTESRPAESELLPRRPRTSVDDALFSPAMAGD